MIRMPASCQKQKIAEKKYDKKADKIRLFHFVTPLCKNKYSRFVEKKNSNFVNYWKVNILTKDADTFILYKSIKRQICRKAETQSQGSKVDFYQIDYDSRLPH